MECVHDDTKWVVDISATIDFSGKRHLECKTCGEILKNEDIPKLELTQSDIETKLEAAVVKVICYDYDGKTEICQGSGFFIDNKGTFITNAHIIKDCFYIKVKSFLGITYDVNVIYKYDDTHSDYAICRAQNYFFSQAVEFAESASVGDTVYALGYSEGSSKVSTTSGKITNINVSDGMKNFYANTAQSDIGKEGGILANEKGRVIGIINSNYNEDEYIALKYKDFKNEIKSAYANGYEPMKYFYSVEKIWLSASNMEEYLDIIVNENKVNEKTIRYDITVKLKDTYKDAKVVLGFFGLNVNIRINTIFTYNENALFGGILNQQITDTKYLYFSFLNIDEIIEGDTQNINSTAIILDGVNYFNMAISYDIDIVDGNGDIYFYDKIQ